MRELKEQVFSDGLRRLETQINVEITPNQWLKADCVAYTKGEDYQDAQLLITSEIKVLWKDKEKMLIGIAEIMKTYALGSVRKR